ncbi:hypothetical protein EJP67_09380 [Variovorax guangxiensis]|uniref:Uncharacterized protein n=2 Tax=Variovorax guangxiensis TaxID=1775474 RepID=A0A3S0Z8L2_9BURK|nr:hypothetical protein EJP67_09380 [Variovorax guangxiensis]
MPFRKSRYSLILIVLAALFSATTPARADGTVSFEQDVLPLIKARPAFEKFLLGTLKVTDAGSGTRISEQAMPHLGGARMGPYEFKATWHGPDGDVPVTLIIDTNTKFFDRAGREIRNGSLKQAVSVKETFDSIEIEQPR